MTTKVKGQYALVVYEKMNKSGKKRGVQHSNVPETFYDVLELSLIPKNHRIVGDRARVTWIDKTTKKNSCHYVIIKKISGKLRDQNAGSEHNLTRKHVRINRFPDNREELLRMYPVDASTGEIASIQTKIFTKEIQNQRIEKKAAKKTEKIARSTAQNDVEELISKDCGICDNVKFVNSAIVPKDDFLVDLGCTVSSPLNSTSIPQSQSAESTIDSTGPEVATGDTFLSIEEECDRQEAIESRYQTFWATMKELAAVATAENISFLQSVVTSLKVLTISPPDISSLKEEKASYEIPERFKTSGQDKVPIFGGIEFYLSLGVKTAIEMKSYIYRKETREREKSWHLLVRQCLTEVYGNRLGEHSAKGAKGAGYRPAIDGDLYTALLYWAREWSEDDISDEEFVNFINKTAYNKRKAANQKNKKQEKKKQEKNKDKEEIKPTSPKNSCDLSKKKRTYSDQSTQQLSKESVEKLSEPDIEEQSHSSKPVELHPQIPPEQQLKPPDPQKLIEPSQKAAVPVLRDDAFDPRGSVRVDPYQSFENAWISPNPQNPHYFNNFQQTHHYENPQYFQYPPYHKTYHPIPNHGDFENLPSTQNFQTNMSENFQYDQTRHYSSTPRSHHSPKMDYEEL